MLGIPDIIRDLLGDGNTSAIVITFATVIFVASIGLLTPLLSIWVERKISARFQDRIGPNRVGPFGLLQAPADALKLLTKEQITPRGADKIVFFVAPIIMVISVIMIMAIIPLNQHHVGTDLSIGVLYMMSIASLGTIAILMGGWGSNNKYALLGAFRVIAQLISYEVPMVLALLVPVMLAGTMRIQGIITVQGDMWFFFIAPISAILFFVASTAEVGRQPFDLLEAESEIVAGYNIEYSGMMFGIFYLGEWLHAIIICVLTALIFLGGWWGPGVQEVPALGILYLVGKSAALYFVHMWIRFTVPRLRIDHLMAFNWKFLVPLSIFNLLLMAFIWKAMPVPTEAGFWAEVPRTLVMLAGNVFLVVGILVILRSYAAREREKVEALVDEAEYRPSRPSIAVGD